MRFFCFSPPPPPSQPGRCVFISGGDDFFWSWLVCVHDRRYTAWFNTTSNKVRLTSSSTPEKMRFNLYLRTRTKRWDKIRTSQVTSHTSIQS
jgi:hypothetical protein